MPSINNLKKNVEKKSFKKKNYRAYNFENKNEVKNQNSSDTIIKINCDEIINWEYHDRPENELGDIESFAKELKSIGQQQPCIVRPYHKNKKYKYELIAGQRRWYAAKLADIKLKVIVNELSDSEAALVQSAENNNRKELSDYAKGMSYAKLIEKKVITQQELGDKLNLDKRIISRFMSFSKLPQSVKEKISDFSKISAYTAECLKIICNKGDKYTEIVLGLSDKLKEGKVGGDKLTILVDERLNSFSKYKEKILYTHATNLFNWKKNKRGQFSVTFSKNVNAIINNEEDFFKKEIINYFEKLFKK